MTEMIIALTELVKATTQLVNKKLGEPYQPALNAPQEPEPRPKRAKKVEPAAELKAEPKNDVEDQLGLGGEEPKPEAPKLTPKESEARMDEVTRQYVRLYKTDTPDGKTRAMDLMKNTFKVETLKNLTHEQRLEWIAAMEKGVLEHK